MGRIAANSFGLHMDSPAATAGGTAGCAAGDASGGEQRTAVEGGGAAGLSDGPSSATVDAAARLQRLQLAQRRLWEDDAATVEIDTTPAELDAAAAAAKRQQQQQQRNSTAELGDAAAREPESGGAAAAADGAAAAPAASEAAAGAEGAAAAAPGDLPPDVDSAGGGGPMAAATQAKDGPAAAHSNCPLSAAAQAGDGLGVADHAGRGCSEPVGRELFISASYFNHRWSSISVCSVQIILKNFVHLICFHTQNREVSTPIARSNIGIVDQLSAVCSVCLVHLVYSVCLVGGHACCWTSQAKISLFAELVFFKLGCSCQPNCIIRRRAAFGVVTAQADIKVPPLLPATLLLHAAVSYISTNSSLCP